VTLFGRLDEPELVRLEYATDAGLAGRLAAYRFAEGPDARETAIAAVVEAHPRRVLEVGCGQGEMAERITRELGCELTAVDQSEHMVGLTRARDIDAVVGDVQKLPFGDGEFDVALAAWMLYHVPDVDRALSELARVLRPQGRLVAVTNADEHLRELGVLLGGTGLDTSFSGENGEAQLLRHFSTVERREAYGWIVFPGRSEAQAYVDATAALSGGGRELPAFEGPLRVRRAPVIFVAQLA
jgi:SAM-dependent methyltransferase